MNDYNFDFSETIIPIAEKLAKLVTQLDDPGLDSLVLSKIRKLLSERKCKFPDIAGLIERAALTKQAETVLKQAKNTGLTAEEANQIYQAAYAQGRQEAQAEQTSKPPSWREMIKVCCANIDHLNAKDQDFIRNQRSKILFDDDEPRSDKVKSWIKDCYRKVHINGNVHSV